jgi:LysR family nod box-dependent transcriptional activator
MRFQKLDLNLLHALDVLLVEKNITKAAKVLHLSQSSVSAILSRLREYFEDELLVQVGRSMVPTTTALSLQEPVHDLLLRIQSTLEIRPHFDPAKCTRHFRLIASDYATNVFLDDLVKLLAEEAPNAVVEILHPSAATMEQMNRGEADLMLLPQRYAPDHLLGEKLLDDSFSCIVCKDHPVIRDAISTEQFLSLGHVVARFPGSVMPFADEHLSRAGYALRNEIIIGNFSNIAMMVVGTSRIGTIHTRLAYKLARYYPVRVLPPPVDIPEMQIQMLWHPYQAKDQAHVWLRSRVREAVLRAPAHVVRAQVQASQPACVP